MGADPGLRQPVWLALEVQQSSNIFTVGGSLGVNARGRDPRFGWVIETVKSFRIMNGAGEVLNVSRLENSELFDGVVNGKAGQAQKGMQGSIAG